MSSKERSYVVYVNGETASVNGSSAFRFTIQSMQRHLQKQTKNIGGCSLDYYSQADLRLFRFSSTGSS